MYRGADRQIASCQMAKDFLIQNGAITSKISIVFNAVDNDFFIAQRKKWEPKRTDLRTELGIKDTAFCFIFVGQLVARKRVIETVNLLESVSKIRQIHLLVAGTGPLESEMRGKAEKMGFDAITFCGYSNPVRLSQLYVASDALILLSKDEPWGMVVNEAVLFNKGFITTDDVAAGVEFSDFQKGKVSQFTNINRDYLIEIIDEIAASNLTGDFSLITPSAMASLFIEAAIC